MFRAGFGAGGRCTATVGGVSRSRVRRRGPGCGGATGARCGRDRAFWVAVGLSAVVMVVIEFALSDAEHACWAGWPSALIALALVVLVVSLVGVAAGVIRGFADGWRCEPLPAPLGPLGPDGHGAGRRPPIRRRRAGTGRARPTRTVPRSPARPCPTRSRTWRRRPGAQADQRRRRPHRPRPGSSRRAPPGRAYRKDD